MGKELFRKKITEKISSPEQLSDYLKVTNPSVWIILGAVLLLVAGLLAWGANGTIDNSVDARTIVRDGQASAVMISDSSAAIQSGMVLRIGSEESVIGRVEKDEYGRDIAYADFPISDGSYDSKIVVDKISPIRFMLENR